MKTQTEKLKKQEKERDFFCVVSDAFRVFARHSSIALGSAWAFAGAVLVILVWVLTGPMFHFSDTWQLVINTATMTQCFFLAPPQERNDTKYASACLWFQNFAEPTWKFFNYLGLRFRPLLRISGRIVCVLVTGHRDNSLPSFNRLMRPSMMRMYTLT